VSSCVRGSKDLLKEDQERFQDKRYGAYKDAAQQRQDNRKYEFRSESPVERCHQGPEQRT
jgi:hypothetical protein